MKRNLIAILIFSLHHVVFSNQLDFVGVGEKNKYCDIKALITRDKEFAKLYINNNEFDEYYEFKTYHLFIRE